MQENSEYMRPNTNLLQKAARSARRMSIALALIVATSAPASAHELDTPFYIAAQTFILLKRMSIACDKPEDEFRAYRKKLLGILEQTGDIDMMSVRKALDRMYQAEASLGGLACTDGLQERYKHTIERGVNKELDYLQEEVDEYRKRNQ